MTVFLSRLTLNPEHALAQKDLAAPYELHRTLGRAFPQADTAQYRQECGVLFRVEPPTARGAAVLVQSGAEPAWDRLEPGYLIAADGPTDFDPSIDEDRRLRFRLAANPVRRTRKPGPKPKGRVRRLPLVHAGPNEAGHDTYWDWLDRQAERAGFAVDRDHTLDLPFRVARRRKLGEEIARKADVPHFGVRFDGILTVTDPGALSAALRQGIGPAKAFGFGLLSLARP